MQEVLFSKRLWHGQGVSSSSPAESAASFFLAALASSRLSGGLKKTGFPQAMAATIVRTGLMHLHQAGTVVVRLAAVMLLQLLTQVLLRKSVTSCREIHMVVLKEHPPEHGGIDKGLCKTDVDRHLA